MGYEAKDFYRYITEPEASAAEYAACQALACRVSACMEKLRADGGIRFRPTGKANTSEKHGDRPPSVLFC